MKNDILKLLLVAGAGYIAGRIIYKNQIKNFGAVEDKTNSDIYLVRTSKYIDNGTQARGIDLTGTIEYKKFI